MCGFCGFTGELENREQVLREMAEVITHRGPDSEGYYLDDGVAMAFPPTEHHRSGIRQPADL